MATTLEVSYFNTFWLKRLKNFAQEQKREQDGTVTSTSGGTTTGTPNLVTGAGYINNNSYEDWFVEEARIKGGYNNTSVDFGNKAYIVEENALASEILSQMNKRKITNVCVYKKNNKKKTIGVIHIHNLLDVLK